MIFKFMLKVDSKRAGYHVPSSIAVSYTHLDVYKRQEDNTPIAGAVFGLYADEDIKNVDGRVIIEKGTLLDVYKRQTVSVAPVSSAPLVISVFVNSKVVGVFIYSLLYTCLLYTSRCV